MIVLNFEVIKQTVSQKNFEKLVNDSSNYVKLCFNFKDPDWSDVCKRILFHSHSSETYCKELDENHEVIVPWEVLTDDYFIFNLYGVKDNLRITTNQKRVSLGDSGYTDEIEKLLPPTPETIDDLYNKINEADSSIAVVDGRVDATNETVSSISSELNQTKTNVTNLGTSLNGAIQDINGLESGLAQTNSNVSGLDDRLDGVDTSITGLTNGLNQANTNITGLTNGLSQTNTNVANLTSGLANTNETVSGLGDSLSQATGDITTLNNGLSQANTNITNITQKLNNTIQMEVTYMDDTQETFNVVVKENESN